MKKDVLQTLRNFANSGVWDILRDEVFEPLIDKVKDVSVPFKIGDKVIEPEKAYLAKTLTTQKLKGIVEMFNRLQNPNVKAKEINFE